MPDLTATQAAVRQSRRVLYVGVATAVLVMVVGATIGAMHLRREADARSAVTTQNLVQSLDLTIDGMIDTIDVLLQVSADEVGKLASAARPDATAISRYLEHQHRRVENAAYVRATNERGDIIYGTGVGSPVPNVSDREYFIRLRDEPAAGLVVAGPIVGRSSGKWVWPFARRYSKADGSFGGVVFAAVYIAGVEQTLANIKLEAGNSLDLRDADMGLIAREPPAASSNMPVGDIRLSLPFQHALRQNRDEGTYVSGETSIDGVSRVHSFRRNVKFGYTINAGAATAPDSSAWRKQVAGISGLTLAFVLGSLAFTWLIRRAWLRQETDLATVEASRQSLEEAQRIASLGTYAYDLRRDVWTSSGVLDGIFGIGRDYPRDAVHWLDLIDPQSRAETQAHLNAVIEQRLPFDHEYGIVRPADGERRWVHGKGRLQFDAQGTPLTLDGTIQDITDRHSMEQALLKRQAELQEIYQSLQTMREEERRRLARELHDDLGQRVTALRMDLDWLDARLLAAPPVMKEKMAGVGRQIDELTDSIRRITEDMRPGMLDALGLVPALQNYADKFSQRTGIHCELTASDDDIQVADHIGIGIYRIVQEALNNTFKHAAASRVAITLRRTGNAVALTIADDGIGLPEATEDDRRGFGLLGMRERVATLNGEFRLTSQPGQGVRIEAVVPL